VIADGKVHRHDAPIDALGELGEPAIDQRLRRRVPLRELSDLVPEVFDGNFDSIQTPLDLVEPAFDRLEPAVSSCKARVDFARAGRLSLRAGRLSPPADRLSPRAD
jgi:hypothetical protein